MLICEMFNGTFSEVRILPWILHISTFVECAAEFIAIMRVKANARKSVISIPLFFDIILLIALLV